MRSPTFRHRLEHFLMDPSTGPRWYFVVPLIGIGLALVGGVVFKLATHGHTDPDEESDPSDEPDADDDSGSEESSEGE